VLDIRLVMESSNVDSDVTLVRWVTTSSNESKNYNLSTVCQRANIVTHSTKTSLLVWSLTNDALPSYRLCLRMKKKIQLGKAK